MASNRLVCACFAVLFAGGCKNDGRPRFISDRGVTKEVVDAQGTSPASDGLLYQFKLAAAQARPISAGPNPNLLPNNDPVKQRTFMNAGFALIQVRCNEYILAKADNQRQVNVWRDTFAPITALLTGAVALLGKGGDTDNDVLTALSLGTSAASAGFRIYEQRYLFGAENVNSVRLLVLKAVGDNAKEASKTTDANLDYSQAVVHLINNQAVCSPGHILQLVREAIDAGKIVSIKTGDASTPPAATKAEDELKEAKALLDQLKKDNVLTDADINSAKTKVGGAKPPPPTPVKSLETVQTKVQSQ